MAGSVSVRIHREVFCVFFQSLGICNILAILAILTILTISISIYPIILYIKEERTL